MVRRYCGDPEYHASRMTGWARATRCGGSCPPATSAAQYVVMRASWSYSAPSCTSSIGAGSSSARSTGLQTVTGTSSAVSPASDIDLQPALDGRRRQPPRRCVPGQLEHRPVTEGGAHAHRVGRVEHHLDLVAACHGEAVLEPLQRRARHVEHPPGGVAPELARPRDHAVALQHHAGDRGLGEVEPEPDVVVEELGGHRVRTARSSGPCGPCARARRACRRPRTARAGGCGRGRARRPRSCRTRSSSRLNASSTWPPSRSRSATTMAASTSVGSAAAAARAAARSTPWVRCMSRTWAEPELGVVVVGVLGQRLLVRRDGTVEVSALDGVEGLLVQRRQRVGVVGTLHGLELDPAGDAVLHGGLEQLVEHRAHLALGRRHPGTAAPAGPGAGRRSPARSAGRTPARAAAGTPGAARARSTGRR